MFKALMKADSSDYGDGVQLLGRRKSSKAVAAPAEDNADEDAGEAGGATPALANGNGRMDHMHGSAGPSTAGKPACHPARITINSQCCMASLMDSFQIPVAQYCAHFAVLSINFKPANRSKAEAQIGSRTAKCASF